MRQYGVVLSMLSTTSRLFADESFLALRPGIPMPPEIPNRSVAPRNVPRDFCAVLPRRLFAGNDSESK